MRGLERRGLRGGAKGELVHVDLAERQAARIEHALHARGGIGALVGLEHARGAGGARAHEVHVVLNGKRHARERRQGLSRSAARIDGRGSVEGKLGRDLQVRLNLRIARIDGRQRGVRDLGGREIARRDARCNLGGGEGIEVREH